MLPTEPSQTHEHIPSSRSLEQIVSRFERNWAAGRRPRLECFINDAPGSRDEVLRELVHVDFEYRLKAGEPVRVEEYLHRFPELAANANDVVDLLAVEYQLRLRNEKKSIDEEEYKRRFPQFATEIGPRLSAHNLNPRTTHPNQDQAVAGTVDFDGVANNEADSRSTQSTFPSIPPPSTQEPKRVSKTSVPLPRIPGYEILAVLGRGGMGVVFKARQLNLKRDVALKMILAGDWAEDDERRRFLQEAEAVAQLQHPNIVQIHDVSEHQGQPYFSLELVDGGNLAGKLAGQPQPPMEAATRVEQLARAVQHAHERGIVHRDLKPANVLLMADGTPKITDFGLAKRLEAEDQTQTGAVIGTPNYMAPEQAEGKIKAIGPATDVYALGAILYEMLTGRPPFKGENMLKTLEQVRLAEPAPPSRLQPRIPRDLETICLKCLAKAPAQRYPSALALANDLARFRAGEPILSRREGLVRRTVRKIHRYPKSTLAVLTTATVLAVALFAILFSYQSWRIGGLQQHIVARIEQIDGSSGQMAATESSIDELASLAPEAAQALRLQLNKRFAAFIEKKITSSRLRTDADVAEIRSMISLLDKRDSALAAKRREALNLVIRQWAEVFELKSPFKQTKDVFTAGIVRPENGRLLREQPALPSKLPIVATQVASQGSVKLEAVFTIPGDENGLSLGLALQAEAERGYFFQVHRRVETKGAEKTPGPVVVQILRDNVILAEQVVSLPARLAEVRCWASREGNRLTCRVNNGPLLEFDDPFALSQSAQGVFGVLISGSVGLKELRGFRRLESASALKRPLDQGDEMYEKKLFPEALAFYLSEMARGGETPLGREAEFKAALCLHQQRREEEALRMLEQLAARDGQVWPVLASCQLWVLSLERNKSEDQGRIELARQHLESRNLNAKTLSAIIPLNIRNRIALSYHVPPDEFWLAKNPGDHARRIAQIVKVYGLMNPADKSAYPLAVEKLVKAYRLAGRADDALAAAKKYFNEATYWTDSSVRILEQVCWILRQAGRESEAWQYFQQQQRSIKSGNSVWTEAAVVMLGVEEARNLAATGRPADAERVLDALIETETAKSRRNRVLLSTAWLLKGFLLEKRNQPQQARSAWLHGAESWRADGADITAASLRPVLHYSILASLSDTLSEEHAAEIKNVLIRKLSGDSPAGQMLLRYQHLQPAKVYQMMWRRSRGKELARQFAFYDMRYQDVFRRPLILLAAETVFQTSLSKDPTPDQEQLVMELSARIFDQYHADKLSLIGFGLAAKVYQSKSNHVSWPFARGFLDKSLRGRMAYVLGLRYRRENHQAEATAFFREALQNAGQDSLLERLAQEELNR